MRVHNEEMRNHNAYLRCQLRDSMKQKGKSIWSSPSSNSSEYTQEEGEKEGVILLVLQVKRSL